MSKWYTCTYKYNVYKLMAVIAAGSAYAALSNGCNLWTPWSSGLILRTLCVRPGEFILWISILVQLWTPKKVCVHIAAKGIRVTKLKSLYHSNNK